MSNVLIINAHQKYPFSEGKLNQTLVDKASKWLGENGHQVRVVTMSDSFDVEQEIANHQWADTIILQSPVNWMGVPWLFKKYMDEVYTAGMAGQLCAGDGRTSAEPTANYGTGGTLTGKNYMLSLTFNAPAQAFEDPAEYLFEGKSVDDLFFPMHMNFRFFGMQALTTFASFDVMKNPQIEQDLARFEAHLAAQFK
ncbi:NAD(P)H-dependent oxidoreductase [Shewanella sp. WXL01]|uniref:NAD(P)H-dependent oxidoreductase n=1 Tax=Shewanella sp. WXL01 TaxID=2709721 RepID=UPI0014385168|nr:NAD(P)H-dependent oxidoreductase [Shewanella sp. WXL01]NKF50440.1 NAD(P)H-dependent oxidoreductase [Shewanella sp. WXL01]